MSEGFTTPFDETHGSPYGVFNGMTWEYYREGVTAWSDINAFAQELMPPSTTLLGPGLAGQFYGAPLPSNTRFRVALFEFHPFGGVTNSPDVFGINTYNKAKWKITYRVPYYNGNQQGKDPVGFLQHESTTGGEYLSLPGAGVSWEPSTASFRPHVRDTHAGIFIATTEHTLTWERVQSPPFSTMRACQGCVNSTAMTFETGTIDPETNLFIGPEWSRQIMVDGSFAWRIKYKFAEKRVQASDQSTTGGWNHFYRDQGSKSGFYRLYRIKQGPDGTYNQYPSANLNALFQSGS